jgi:hypothetical protein
MAAQLMATNLPLRLEAACSPCAGAALAQQQHRSAAAGHALDEAADAQHLGVARQQPGQRIGLGHGLQAAVFLLQLGQAVGAFDGQRQHLGVEGLGLEVVGAQGHRAQRVRLVVLAGEHDDLQVGVDVQHLAQQLEAFRHRIGVGRQTQVHGHHAGVEAAQLHQRGLAVARRHRFEAVQRPLDLLLQSEVVLDDEQRRRAGVAHTLFRVETGAAHASKGRDGTPETPSLTEVLPIGRSIES